VDESILGAPNLGAPKVDESILVAPKLDASSMDELSAHMVYMAFKKSHRKRYEKKQGAESAKPLWRTAAQT